MAADFDAGIGGVDSIQLPDAAQEASQRSCNCANISDICSWKLLQDAPLQLGGPGVIVQIDKSFSVLS